MTSSHECQLITSLPVGRHGAWIVIEFAAETGAATAVVKEQQPCFNYEAINENNVDAQTPDKTLSRRTPPC